MGRKPKSQNPVKFHTIETAKPPEWLDDLALSHWHSIEPELKQLGLLSTVDLESLGMLCQTYSHYRHCEDALREEGMTYRTQAGVIRVHPLADKQNQYQEAYRKLAADFGIVAANRRKIEVGTQAKPSRLRKFLEKNG